jgi:prepilin-type N-terminal cleavage/methylation domain-containing protein
MLTRLRGGLRRLRGGDESGVTLVEMLIALVLFSIVIVSVDSSLTVVTERQVQVTNGTQALDNIQGAQEALTRDIESSTAWTTPAVPTSAPSTPVTATWTGSGSGLVFTADLNEALATITVALNTTTHKLTVTCADLNSDSACGGAAGGTQTQASVANIDSSSSITMTTAEVTSTINSVTTNSFFFTDVASTLILDSPSVGAAHVTQTTLSSPSIIPYNVVYACQTAASAEGANGTC